MITTCVILNYNDSDTTINLLNQIKNFDSIDYIIVVDNLSTDSSFTILQGYESEKIRVLRTDYNGGYGYGNNYGIRYAYDCFKTSYILIANPDVEFDNQCVKELKKAIVEHPECAIVTAREENNKWLNAWRIPNVLEDTLSFELLCSKVMNLHYSDKYLLEKSQCYVDIVSGSLLLVDASKMIKYGMYDEDIFLYEEEKILGIKFKQSGFKTLLLLTNKYYHHHSISISKTYKSELKRKKLQLESRITFLKKYRGLKYPATKLVELFFYLVLIETIIYSKCRDSIKLINTSRLRT